MKTYFSGKEWLVGPLKWLRNEQFHDLYAFFFFVSILLISYLALDRFIVIDDHFFHIRFVQLAAEQGLRAFTDFQSIYLSELSRAGEHLIYYNFLFYIALWPFSLIAPPVLGIKLFGLLVMAGSLTTVYAILRRIGVRQAFLWTVFFLIVLAESGLLVRLLSARPFALAPVFLILLLYFLYRERRYAAGTLAFAYFYWHTATFFLPVLVAVGYFVLDRYYRAEKFDWHILIWPLGGTVAAVVTSYLIFPGVLSYLIDITLPVLIDAALPGGVGVAEGMEVYGVNFFSIFVPLFPLIGLLVMFGIPEAAALLRNHPLETSDRRLGVLRTTLFLGSVTLLAASLFSLRFTDYFVYFAIVYVALAVSRFAWPVSIAQEPVWRELKIGAFIVLGLFVMDIGPSIRATDIDATRVSYLSAQGPADWMLTHLKPGAIVFNTDWDMFALLYYFTGDQIRFATGLEPRFLYDYSPRLYWLWKHIGDRGAYCEAAECPASPASLGEGDRIADAVLRDFETDIMIVRSDRTELVSLLDESPRFRAEYRDAAHSIFIIYRVLNADSVRVGK